ncbi:hypothetical protein [Mycolicibacter sinensis]|uniref:hypothetical protein n=1 Tax=Mycolicibacter sinensis (strain JDM601) TaxID=875328 RepID=UPI00059B85D1|nr:hypothetical protein [Mycolicibacter sinensis]
MSTLTFDAPMAPRGFMAKTGALVASTAFAGAALFGGVAVAPTVASSLSASVQHDYVLTADPAPVITDFVGSLQYLLDQLGFGNIGQVLGLFGTEASPVGAGSELSVLLANLNPDNVSLDTVTMGLLSTDLTALLNDVNLPVGDGATAPLGDVPLIGLIGSFIGGTDGINTSVGDLLTALGFGPYVGLLNLAFLGIDVTPDTSVADLLNDMLGIDGSTTINTLLDDNGFGEATIASLMGISSEQLGAGWDDFLDSIKLGTSIMDPTGDGTLGAQTLGDLLTSLLGPDATDVTDATTLTDFLGDLGIWDMLGLT